MVCSFAPSYRTVLLVVWATWICYGCQGSSMSVCLPENCTGCCHKGQCVSGDVPMACGAGGNICTQCADGDFCQHGQCQATGGSCLNCQGCCQGGRCQAGNTSATCGQNTANLNPAPACLACSAGQSCVQGLCQNDGPKCSPSLCGGCCSGDNCILPNTDALCGLTGQACFACTGTKICFEGACLDTAGCADCSKFSGRCCQNNSCVMGNTNAACGKGGSPCDVCEDDEVCFDGTCVPATVQCSYKTCATGCCGPNGCRRPSTDATCGIGGVGCRACGPWEYCAGGTCVPKDTACARSCILGCCYGGQCLPFAQQSPLLCGNTGQACRSCDRVRGEICDTSQGVCNLPASGKCPNCTAIDKCCNSSNRCVNGESNLQCGSKGNQCQNCTISPFGSGFSCVNQVGTGLNKCDDGGGGTHTICVQSVQVDCGGGSAACENDLKEPGGPPLGFEVHIRVGLVTGKTAGAPASWTPGQAMAIANFASQCPQAGLTEKDLQGAVTLKVYETDPGFGNPDDLIVSDCELTSGDVQAGLTSGTSQVNCFTNDGGVATVVLLFR